MKYTFHDYRYAVNESGLSYARVKYEPDGTPVAIECRVDTRHGRSHWRYMWRKGQPKPMSDYCKKILDDARCV